MRKYLIAAAAAGSALVAAAPAAAQYYPAPQPYPYGYQQPGYGYQQPGYGYQQPYNYGYNQHGLIRNYMGRVDQLLNRIGRLDSRDRISEREARGLRNQALQLRHRIARSSYNGLSGRERQDINYRLARLEQRIEIERRDRDGRNDRRRYRDGQWTDRDRDGRIDQYEDDRGRYPG